MEKNQRICEYELHHTVTAVPCIDNKGELDEWGTAMYILLDNTDFCELNDECWQDLSKRKTFSSRFNSTLKMAAVTGLSDKKLLEDLGPALGLLSLGNLDPVYLEMTAYNPFTVLRIGNFLAAQPVSVPDANIRPS